MKILKASCRFLGKCSQQDLNFRNFLFSWTRLRTGYLYFWKLFRRFWCSQPGSYLRTSIWKPLNYMTLLDFAGWESFIQVKVSIFLRELKKKTTQTNDRIHSIVWSVTYMKTAITITVIIINFEIEKKKKYGHWKPWMAFFKIVLSIRKIVDIL